MVLELDRDFPTRIVLQVSRFFDDLTEPFLDHRREDVSFLKVLLRHENFDEIRELGHEIRGTTSVYGFPEMAKIGRAIEKAAWQRRLDLLATIAAELGDYLDRVEVVFE